VCDWKWITVLEGETHTLDKGISRGEARLAFPGAHASDWKWVTVLEGETHTLDEGISRGEARLAFPV